MEVLKIASWLETSEYQFKFDGNDAIRLKDGKRFCVNQYVSVIKDAGYLYQISKFFIGDQIHVLLVVHTKGIIKKVEMNDIF